MIAWWGIAAAAPVLSNDSAQDPFARCVAAADAEAGVTSGSVQLVPDSSDKIAVVIGIPCHHSPQIPSLQYSTRDATEMGAHLADAGFDVVPLLTSVDRRTLLDTLDRVQRSLAPDGLLVVYFSGHGALREEGGELHRYLVMSDTELGAVHMTGLSVRTLEDRVDQIAAGSRVIIQDTCYADRPTGPVVERDKGVLPLEPGIELQAGDFRLYGSRYFEQAVESVDLRGSIYTVRLLEAMNEPGADLDGDSCVGLLEAHSWARDRVVADRAGYQVPQLRSNAHGEDAAYLLSVCSSSAPKRAVLDVPTEEGWSLSVRDAMGRAVLGRSLLPGRYRFTMSELVPSDTGDLTRQIRFDGVRSVHAGQWLALHDEIANLRPLRWISATADSAWTHELPLFGLGLEGRLALADRGKGRLIVGLGGGYRPGPGGTRTYSPKEDNAAASGEVAFQPIAFRAGEIEGSLRPTRTLLLRRDDVLLIGPAFVFGAVIRDAYSPARSSVQPQVDSSPPLFGSFGEVAIGITYSHKPLLLSADLGTRALLLARERGLPVRLMPVLSLGIGREL